MNVVAAYEYEETAYEYLPEPAILLTHEELEGLREVEAANLAEEMEEYLHIYFD